jgi:hypothetical protein
VRGQEEGGRAATTSYALAVGGQATHLSYRQFPVSVLVIKLNFLRVQVFPLVVYYGCGSYYLAFWAFTLTFFIPYASPVQCYHATGQA